MDNILEVKNLKISFRTQAGTLKAVRDISLDLKRGKTLAIVGESGSGKSVTAKAILGILAGNTIIEGGEILYDGKDLLKISEEDFHNIRGDKISMIFQDPLSSLDPIVKIGKQITEAMLLKSSTNRREAKKEFNSRLAILKKSMVDAMGQSHAAEAQELCQTFNKTCIEANHLENAYNIAFTGAADLLSYTEDFLFKAEKKQKLDVKGLLRDYKSRLHKIRDPFLTRGMEEQMESLGNELGDAARAYVPKTGDVTGAVEVMQKLETLLKELTGKERPDFVSIAYYKLFDPEAKLDRPQSELETVARKFMNEKFLDRFREVEEKAVTYSYDQGEVQGPFRRDRSFHRSAGIHQGQPGLHLPQRSFQRHQELLLLPEAESQGGSALCPPDQAAGAAHRPGQERHLEGGPQGGLRKGGAAGQHPHHHRPAEGALRGIHRRRPRHGLP